MNGSFELAWGNAPNMVRRIIPFIQPAVKIQPYSLLLFSVASLYVQFMLPHSSFLQCWYTNQHWYQKSVETSDTELLEFLHCRSPSSCAVKRASHRFMTWEKPMRSEISLNIRHVHSSSVYLFSGFEQIVLSALFAVIQEKACQKGAIHWDQSYYIQSSVCLLFVGVRLFDVHLYVHIILPFLKCEQPNPAATQAKAQVLSLLLSHWVGQWIKLLYISTAALCVSLLWRKTASLGYAASRTC